MSLSPAAAASLHKWHDMIANVDLSDLESIVADKAEFRSADGYFVRRRE